MAFSYRPKGVCSRGVTFDIKDGRVVDAQIIEL